MKITITEAKLEDYPTIQNMARFYVYEMSRYCKWECPGDGLYECDDLKHYFEKEDNYAFFIKANGELAGFIMVNKIGSNINIDWNIGEFFVLAKFQGSSVGKKAAYAIFERFRGHWEVGSMPDNLGAKSFWKKVINEYTKGSFAEQEKIIEHPVPHPMVILSFNNS